MSDHRSFVLDANGPREVVVLLPQGVLLVLLVLLVILLPIILRREVLVARANESWFIPEPGNKQQE